MHENFEKWIHNMMSKHAQVVKNDNMKVNFIEFCNQIKIITLFLPSTSLFNTIFMISVISLHVALRYSTQTA